MQPSIKVLQRTLPTKADALNTSTSSQPTRPKIDSTTPLAYQTHRILREHSLAAPLQHPSPHFSMSHESRSICTSTGYQLSFCLGGGHFPSKIWFNANHGEDDDYDDVLYFDNIAEPGEEGLAVWPHSNTSSTQLHSSTAKN